MTVTTRSSAGGASAQSHSTTPGSTITSTRKPKKTRSQWTPEASTAGSGRRGGKRNIPSRDSDGEDDIDADDEQHPPECSPPPKRRRKNGRAPGKRDRSKSNADATTTTQLNKQRSTNDLTGLDSGHAPGNSRINPQRKRPKKETKRDKAAVEDGNTSKTLGTIRRQATSGPHAIVTSEQVDNFSSSLSELTTTESDGSPLPLPAPALPPITSEVINEPIPPAVNEEDDLLVPASDAESIVPASQPGSVVAGSQDSSVVPASVSGGSSQVMDMSCTQEANGNEAALVTQTTHTLSSEQQSGPTQDGLGSFSMEESFPGSAMDTQTSQGAEDEDKLSYMSDEDQNLPIPARVDAAPAPDAPLFDNAPWSAAPPDDGFIPPAPVMKDLDVFSQSQPYSSQGGTQRDFASSSQMSFASSAGQVSPNRPPSFRYPLLPGPSANDGGQRPSPRFESPFAQTFGTTRAVPNTKRNFALGVDAIQFDEPRQIPAPAFPPPLPSPEPQDPPSSLNRSNTED